MNFSAPFEAIAIEARWRQRWDGVNDKTRWIFADGKRIAIPFIENRKPLGYLNIGTEMIDLETLWIGNHRYMRMGYGPHINCLIVSSIIP